MVSGTKGEKNCQLSIINCQLIRIFADVFIKVNGRHRKR
jgi:hypothetical protein